MFYETNKAQKSLLENWANWAFDTQESQKMKDDELSSSELRNRYHRGGTAKDAELSASQLRSRHNVEGRNFDVSGNPSKTLKNFNQLTVIVAFVFVLLVGGVFFFLTR